MEKAFFIWWVSEDRQNSMLMGEHYTREEAEADLPKAQADMLKMGNDDDKAWIKAGTWRIEEWR